MLINWGLVKQAVEGSLCRFWFLYSSMLNSVLFGVTVTIVFAGFTTCIAIPNGDPLNNAKST